MSEQDQECLKLPFENQGVRIFSKAGEVWFVLADVCKVLEIGNTSMAAARLDRDEKADLTITEVSSNGVKQARDYLLVNESGFYSLVLRSRKPQARRFRKWVTAEVLPAIRKTGRYNSSQQPVTAATDEFTPAQKMYLLEREKQALRDRLSDAHRMINLQDVFLKRLFSEAS